MIFEVEKIYSQFYIFDYVYYGQIELMVVVVSVDNDGQGVEVWVGMQIQFWIMYIVVEIFGIFVENVCFNMMIMGGGFGRCMEFVQNYVCDVLLSLKVVG